MASYIASPGVLFIISSGDILRHLLSENINTHQPRWNFGIWFVWAVPSLVDTTL